MRLFCHGILIGEESFRAGRVHRRHHGHEVLELVEVVCRFLDCAVERVEERGVEGPKGEFGNDVGEIECCADDPD